jgi:hypothetical protein
MRDALTTDFALPVKKRWLRAGWMNASHLHDKFKVPRQASARLAVPDIGGRIEAK